MAKWNKHLTIKQAAELLGEGSDRAAWERVRRRIRRKERDISAPILVDVGEGKAPRWRITEAQLKKHFPECLSRRDQALEYIEERDREFRDELRALRLVVKALGARLRATNRGLCDLQKRTGGHA